MALPTAPRPCWVPAARYGTTLLPRPSQSPARLVRPSPLVADDGWQSRPAAGPFGAALTAYLVRNVNLKLFLAVAPPRPAERDALLRTWYRLNVFTHRRSGRRSAGYLPCKADEPGYPECLKTAARLSGRVLFVAV